MASERVRVAGWVLPAAAVGMGMGWLAGTGLMRVRGAMGHWRRSQHDAGEKTAGED